MKILNKYKNGFVVDFGHPILKEEWLLSREQSSKNKLVFLGYDANLFPMLNFSERSESEHAEKVIKKALELTKDFKGEVWLDDVKIMEVSE